MDNSRNRKQNIGFILIVIYCCVICVLLFCFVPKTLAFFINLVFNTGILIIAILVALGGLNFALAVPIMKLSKKYLYAPNKPFALMCGLIVGLPMTIILIYYSFIINYYHLDGFSAGMIVVSGGIMPFLAIFYAVADPKNFVKG